MLKSMQDLHIFQEILNISQWHVQILHNAFFNNLLQKWKDLYFSTYLDVVV